MSQPITLSQCLEHLVTGLNTAQRYSLGHADLGIKDPATTNTVEGQKSLSVDSTNFIERPTQRTGADAASEGVPEANSIGVSCNGVKIETQAATKPLQSCFTPPRNSMQTSVWRVDEGGDIPLCVELVDYEKPDHGGWYNPPWQGKVSLGDVWRIHPDESATSFELTLEEHDRITREAHEWLFNQEETE